MIYSTLEKAGGQLPQTKAFALAYRFLRNEAINKELPEGKIEIDGDRVYALVQYYETKADTLVGFEAHRRYADIQYVGAGREVIGCAPLEKMKVERGYDAAKDVEIGIVRPDEAIDVKLFAGDLGVFFPSDAHAPRQALSGASRVYKIVVKVAI